MKRAKPLIGLIVLTAAVFVVGWLIQPSDPVNEANFDRIQKGMTEADVERLLESSHYCDDPGGENWRYKGWRGNGNNIITVVFADENGKHVVRGKMFHNPSFWEILNARCRGRGIGALREVW